MGKNKAQYGIKTLLMYREGGCGGRAFFCFVLPFFFLDKGEGSLYEHLF